MRLAVVLAPVVLGVILGVACKREPEHEAKDFPITKYARADARYESGDPHAADLAVVEADAAAYPAPSISAGIAGLRSLFVRTPTLASWMLAPNASADAAPTREAFDRRIRDHFAELLECRAEAGAPGRTVIAVSYVSVPLSGFAGRVLVRAQITTSVPPAVGTCLLDVVRRVVPPSPPGLAFEIVLWS